MATIKTLPERKDTPEPLTWDLTKIFPDDAAWETAFQQVQTQAQQLTKLQGTLGKSAKSLVDGIETILSVYRQFEKVYVYASLKNDQDTRDSKYQGYVAQAQSLAAVVDTNSAFLDPEILTIPTTTLATYREAYPDLKQYDQFLDQILANKAHVLPTKAEELIAAAGDVMANPEQTYGVLSNSDLKFPTVTDSDGQQIQLSAGTYSKLLESPNQNVRKEAFQATYKTFGQFKNTFASTLAGEVKRNNYQAKVHAYPSARDAALAQNHIPVNVYDTLIQEVHAHLDLLHRYVMLRKRILQVSTLHMYDLYTPLTGTPALSYTYQEAQTEALKALAVMGPDYLSHVKDIFNQRNIDVVENKGKRTGAYSGGSYDTDPYILLNWQDNLDNLYTLVHETGHSVHSWYTRHNQPYVYGDYPIFVAEIASTTNENLLTDYLLKTQTDPQVRAYILNYYLDGFKGTVYRQTQFAEFEQFIHDSDQHGKALTADYISKEYLRLNQQYYGAAVESDPEIALEWARIPHFYMDFYVYQYATGFAAASTLAQGIASEKDGAREHYLDFLKSGSSQMPIATMQTAGVDMSRADYLEKAFKLFSDRLDELESLLVRL